MSDPQEVDPREGIAQGCIVMTTGLMFIAVFFPTKLLHTWNLDIDIVFASMVTIIGGSFVIMGAWNLVMGMRDLRNPP